jgi:hypothetical protein
MALGCRLTSVRGNRGKIYEKGTAGSPKTYKEKKRKECSKMYVIITLLLDSSMLHLPFLPKVGTWTKIF